MYLENLLTFPHVSVNALGSILSFILIQRSHSLNKMCNFILLE